MHEVLNTSNTKAFLCGVVLRHGVNKLSDSKFEALKKDPWFDRMIETGVLVVEAEEPKPEEKPKPKKKKKSKKSKDEENK